MSCVEQDVAFIRARFNLTPCLPGGMSQGNPPSLGFGARDFALWGFHWEGRSGNISHFAVTARKNQP